MTKVKKFDEMYNEVFCDLSSTSVAMQLAAAGFGIVPGRGWTDDDVRVWTERGAMARPLYGMDVMTAFASDGLPYYVALDAIGTDTTSMLTIVDVDNGHGVNGISFDEMWERLVGWMSSIGCEEALDTLVVRSPHDGLHIYMRSDIAQLFKWMTELHVDALGNEMSIDWLTAGSSQHLTGPGCERPGAGRYRLYVPRGADITRLAEQVADMPTALLRWLVSADIAAHHDEPASIFRSDIGARRAAKDERLRDIVKLSRTKSEKRKASDVAACDVVGLYRDEPEQHEPGRHTAVVSFAGKVIHKATGSDFDTTCDLIEQEIRAFASERCVPMLPTAEVSSIVRDARRWAEQARDEIEQRCASRVVVVAADGSESTQVVRDWSRRKINGATYRCKPRRNGAPGLPVCSPANVVEALEHDDGLAGCFGYDAMNCRNCIVKPLPWSEQSESFPRFVADADMGRIITYIDEVSGFDATRNFATAFVEVCSRHSFNPLQDFVKGFDGRWDGEDHMGLLARFMGVGSDDVHHGSSFSATCMTLWMRGAIRRALHPGAKFDYTLILTGAQGVGKSTFWQMLAMRDEWFCESLTDIRDSKKSFEQISASWICCIDELAALRSAKDVARVKTYLSARFDDYRAPYKREQERIQRHCVFCGTTNELSFLADRSGNRRFMLVPCDGVMDDDGRPAFFSDPDFGHEIEQAWAQAYAMEAAAPEEPLVLPRWAMDVQAARNDDASVADPLEERLEEVFSAHRLADRPLSYAQVYALAYDVPESDYTRERHLKSFQDLARRVAQRLGWQEGRYRDTWGDASQKKTQRRGFRPVLTDEERRQHAEAMSKRDDEDRLVDVSQLTLYSA